MVLAICVLIAGIAIGFTLFVREQDIPAAPVENPELKHLEERRQVLYENLKDLQFEYHQGKLTDQDYQSLKEGFLYDLAGVMDSIERIEVRPGKLPKPSPKSASAIEQGTGAESKPKSKQKIGGADAEKNICPACKGANPAANRFCGHCGKPLAA